MTNPSSTTWGGASLELQHHMNKQIKASQRDLLFSNQQNES